MIETVIEDLRQLRMGPVDEERDLYVVITRILVKHGLRFRREAQLAHGRIDFLVDGHIGIEVKKGQMQHAATRRQLKRYAKDPRIDHLILVSERGIVTEHNAFEVPFENIALGQNWGIVKS